MIVEHTFITTREVDDAFHSVDQLLGELGFTRSSVFDPANESRGCVQCAYDLKGLPLGAPCPECGMNTNLVRRLEFTRGLKTARNAVYKTHKLPQRVFVEFDRGRMSIAASLETYGNKAEPIHTEMLLTLATIIEQEVCRSQPREAILRVWNDLALKMKARDRRKQLPIYIVLGVIVFVLVAVVIAVVVSSR